jgi:hypothetical protein
LKSAELMKKFRNAIGLMGVFSALFGMILGCGGERAKTPEWTKAKKIAGKEQKLSHISGLVTDEKFAYVTIGGTVADQNEGMSGLRKVDLATGAVTSLDNGENMPQSENGGLALDEKFVYWNGGGKILRIAKDGGKAETVASENVGIGIDMVVDGEKVYWANHGYYSPNSPTRPSPVYVVAKAGGKAEIFADAQNIPHSLAADEKSVYWMTPTSILKKAKAGGDIQTLYQATDKEGVDELAADAENLYFGFRGAGESRWDLRKISKQGGEPQTIVKQYSLKPVAVDDANVYFFNEKGMTGDVLCKVSKNGGEAATLDSGYSSGIITQSKTQIFFAGLDDIYSFTK